MTISVKKYARIFIKLKEKSEMVKFQERNVLIYSVRLGLIYGIGNESF